MKSGLISKLIKEPAGKSPSYIITLNLRSMSFFLCGMLAGYYWLLPVFVSPGSESVFDAGGLAIERVMRILGVLLFFPLIAKRVIALLLREKVLELVLLIFVFIPAFSLLFNPDLAFFISVYGPFAAGGIAIVCISALKREEITSWLFGVGLVATVFLIVGLSLYGLQPSVYYGRSRAHIGFVHPTQTASVILMAGAFAFYCACWLLQRWRWMLWPAIVGIVVCLLRLLIVADSRNTMLMFILIASCTTFAKVVKRPNIRFGMVLIVLSTLLFLGFFAIFGNMHNEFWIFVDSFSSGRLFIFHELIDKILNTFPLLAIFGLPLGSASGGFASAESVYMSIFIDFGFFTFAGFIILIYVLAKRLSKANRPLAYGCLCAVIIYFAIDSQGVTPSNLAIFLALTYSVRNSVFWLVR